MPTVTVSQPMDAPAEVVFDAITNIENLPDTNPDIVKIEFLTDQRSGVGTRFKETRKMGNGEHVTTLEVREYDPEALHYRCVTLDDGTTWDTVMRVERNPVAMVIEMDCNGHVWWKNALHTVMKGMYRRGIASHLKELGAYCERKAMEQSRSNVAQPS